MSEQKNEKIVDKLSVEIELLDSMKASFTGYKKHTSEMHLGILMTPTLLRCVNAEVETKIRIKLLLEDIKETMEKLQKDINRALEEM